MGYNWGFEMIEDKDITDEELDREFNAWLNSIEFVDDEGKIVPPVLTEDESDDPEGDRED